MLFFLLFFFISSTELSLGFTNTVETWQPIAAVHSHKKTVFLRLHAAAAFIQLLISMYVNIHCSLFWKSYAAHLYTPTLACAVSSGCEDTVQLSSPAPTPPGAARWVFACQECARFRASLGISEPGSAEAQFI